MEIRSFKIGDELPLRHVFLSAVQDIAAKDYTPLQIAAWSKAASDIDYWTAKMRQILPFVVESDGHIVAYADLQPTGYIDHFFVSGSMARQGAGTLLMRHILEKANVKGIHILTSDVSITAQPFFEKFGFKVIEHKTRMTNNILFSNAHMEYQIS